MRQSIVDPHFSNVEPATWPKATIERCEAAIERSRRLLELNPVEAAYKLTFTNKEIDHQTDLHYFGARYYHATLPRFISPDPVSGTMEIPTSWNRYLYCRNDPINAFDPDGEDSFLVSRPVEGHKDYSHMFIAAFADYPGDPNATIFSFGQTDDYNTGLVNNQTTNPASNGLSATDLACWDSINFDDPDVAFTQIHAPDQEVSATANAVSRDQDYSALTSFWGISLGVNSNSVALAIAQQSCPGIKVPGDRNALGANAAVKFVINSDNREESNE